MRKGVFLINFGTTAPELIMVTEVSGGGSYFPEMSG